MKVLIVDDEYNCRKNIRMLLERSKYMMESLFEAENGWEALSKLTQEPDIVITDMKMPAMDGVSFLDYLENSKKAYAVIVVSGYSDYIYTRCAIRSKVIDYLLKPVKEEEFYEAFEKAAASVYKASEGKEWDDLKAETGRMIQNGLYVEDFAKESERFYPVLFHFVNFQEVKERQQYTDNLLLYRLEMIIRKEWKGENLVFKSLVRRPEVVLVVEGGDRNGTLMTKSCLEHLLNEIYRQTGVMGTGVIGGAYGELMQLQMELIVAVQRFWGEEPVPETMFEVKYLDKKMPAMKKNESNILNQMLLFIQEHYGERISLDTLTDNFYLSKTYISRIFKKKLCVNFVTYLTDYRLARAKELLEETEDKISVISEKVGFSDYSYFCIVFKKKFGFTPAEFRRKNHCK